MKREVCRGAGLLVLCTLVGWLSGRIVCQMILSDFRTEFWQTTWTGPSLPPPPGKDGYSGYRDIYLGTVVAEQKRFGGVKPDEFSGVKNFKQIIDQIVTDACFFTGWLTGAIVVLVLVVIRISKAIIYRNDGVGSNTQGTSLTGTSNPDNTSSPDCISSVANIAESVEGVHSSGLSTPTRSH